MRVFENERFSTSHGWSNRNLQQDDNSYFSDVTGKQPLACDLLDFSPPSGYGWLGDWYVEVYHTITDDEGYCYHYTFEELNKARIISQNKPHIYKQLDQLVETDNLIFINCTATSMKTQLVRSRSWCRLLVPLNYSYKEINIAQYEMRVSILGLYNVHVNGCVSVEVFLNDLLIDTISHPNFIGNEHPKSLGLFVPNCISFPCNSSVNKHIRFNILKSQQNHDNAQDNILVGCAEGSKHMTEIALSACNNTFIFKLPLKWKFNTDNILKPNLLVQVEVFERTQLFIEPKSIEKYIFDSSLSSLELVPVLVVKSLRFNKTKVFINVLEVSVDMSFFFRCVLCFLLTHASYFAVECIFCF